MEGEGQRTDALEAIVQQTQATPRYARFHGAYAERLLTSSSAASRYPALHPASHDNVSEPGLTHNGPSIVCDPAVSEL